MNGKNDQPTLPAENWLQPLKTFFSPMAEGKGTMLLIWILVLLVIVLNIWVGWLYRAEGKFIDYFDSSTFKALLASLLIPLLMSSISRAFKIGEKIEVEKEKVAHEKRGRQYQAIKDTNSMWSELYDLSTEVAYFKDANAKVSVRELRKKLERFANSAEEVINLWNRISSKFGSENLEMALYGLNLLLLTASTVADAIEKGDAEAADLQNCLLIIQDSVRFALHQRIMLYFNLIAEGNDELVQKTLNEIRATGEFFKEQINVRPNLPAGAPADAFAANREKFAGWYSQYARRQKELPPPQRDAAMPFSPEHIEYYKTIYTIPFDQLGFSRKRLFSNAQIKKFAAEMFYQNDLNKIRASV